MEMRSAWSHSYRKRHWGSETVPGNRTRALRGVADGGPALVVIIPSPFSLSAEHLQLGVYVTQLQLYKATLRSPGCFMGCHRLTTLGSGVLCRACALWGRTFKPLGSRQQ